MKKTRVSADSNQEFVVEEDADIYLSRSKHEEISWPEIENIWKQTTVYRLKAMKDTNFSPIEIQNKWPQYMKPLGYKLIDIDFQRLHSNAADMLSIFDNTKEKLVCILDERIKDPNNRKLLNSIKENGKISENSKNSVIIYLLHALFIPTSKKPYNDFTQVKRSFIKYSISDSQNSHVLVAPTPVMLEEYLNQK